MEFCRVAELQASVSLVHQVALTPPKDPSVNLTKDFTFFFATATVASFHNEGIPLFLKISTR